MSFAPITSSSTTNNQLSLQQQLAASVQPLHQSADTAISSLTLGEVNFADFEIPEKIGTFGGKQVTVVHEFAGGLRQVQAFGPQPEKLAWSGILMGGDPNNGAKARAAAIDTMRARGTLVNCTWGPFKFQVIISAFHVEPQTDWIIPYNIECEIQQDLSQGALQPDGVPGTDESFQALLNGALNSSSVMSSISTVNQPAFQSAISNVQQVQNLWGGQVTGMSADNQNLGTSLLTSSIQGLTPIAQGSTQFDASQAQAMIFQMKNLSNILQGFTGSPPKVTPVINPNLFQLAAVEYGDVTQWPRLAQLNNIPLQPLQSGTFPAFVLEK